MKSALQNVWVAVFVTVGLVCAALSYLLYSGRLYMTGSLWQPFSTAKHSGLANACTLADADNEELFFISCGGIY